jgi:hypothetical protein
MFSKEGLNFIVHIFESDRKKINGGLLCLHKISYELASRGNQVMIFTNPLFPHPNIFVQRGGYKINNNGVYEFFWIPFSFPYDNTVSIYPEIIMNNNFNTKYVARWFLYYPNQKVMETFSETDYYFYYSSLSDLKDKVILKSQGELTVVDLNLENLYIENKNERNGYCYIDRGGQKNTPLNYLELVKKYEAQNLTKEGTLFDYDYLRSQFNKFRYFITFDDKTYLTSSAALCGCIPIVIPRDNKIPFEFRSETPAQRVGVAYGFDDLEWAESTISLVRKHLLEYELFCKKTIDSFINFFQNKIQNID